MVKHNLRLKVITAALLALLMISAVLLAACDTGTSEGDIFESIPDLGSMSTDSSVDTSSKKPPTQDGYADTPEIYDIVNITPDTLFITGTCQEGATITVKGGAEDVSVESYNGYFVAEISLGSTTSRLMEATATVEGLEESEPASFRAEYDATAEKRVDGKGVTIGQSSRLFFDSAIDEYVGKSIMTMTQLRSYKEFIDSRVAALERRAGNYPVSLVYVYIPDYATIYSEYLPESVEKETVYTRLEQIKQNLDSSNAVILDMTDVLMAAKDDEYPIYNSTDSHLSEYGGYLVYKEICNVMAERFPDAAARSLDEFEITSETLNGGDLAYYLGADNEVITENAVMLTPKFSLKLGSLGASGVNVEDVVKYEEGGVRIYTGSESRNTTERLIFGTGRSNLPSALIYRDDSVLPFYDILAERFNNVMFGAAEDFTINMSDAERYKGGNKSIVDYVFMIVSEKNLEMTFEKTNS